MTNHQTLMSDREIKFRAWNTENNEEMLYDVYNHSFYGSLNDCLEQSEVMQYTGLKDKNGTEIYEGDIIGNERIAKFPEREGSGNDRTERGGIWTDLREGTHKPLFLEGEEEAVIYGTYCKIVEWKKESCGFEPFSDSEQNCGHCGGGLDPSGWEIIGNIYEDKNLLEDE